MSNNLFDQLSSMQKEIASAQPENADALEAFRIKYLGSKNLLKPLFSEIKNIEPNRRKEFGQLINQVKKEA